MDGFCAYLGLLLITLLPWISLPLLQDPTPLEVDPIGIHGKTLADFTSFGAVPKSVCGLVFTAKWLIYFSSTEDYTCCIVQQWFRHITCKNNFFGRFAIFSPISPSWVILVWVVKQQNQSFVICNYMEMSFRNVNIKVTATSTDYFRCFICSQVFLLHLN